MRSAAHRYGLGARHAPQFREGRRGALKYFYRLLGRMLLGGLSVGFGAAMLAAALHLAPGGWLTAAAVFVAEPAGAAEILRESVFPAAGKAASLPSIAEASVAAPSPAPSALPASESPASSAEAGSSESGSSPEPSPEPSPTPVPERPDDAGDIASQTYRQGSGIGYITLEAGSIKNSTSNDDSVLAEAAAAGLPFSIELNSEEPQVLILHTHATECYQPWDDLWYDPDFAARSLDTSVNMCAVGAAMTDVLNQAGINTLHDETLHDSPSYTESYGRSAQTARDYLERYPSIKVILDVHRDAIEQDGTRIKPLTQIDGEDTAQVMIIAGCNNGSTVVLPDWEKNLGFAAAWETEMETLYPGLTRPVLCGYRFYNQDVTTGSLLIEIGGHANTLEEAIRAGEYAARALASLFGAA